MSNSILHIKGMVCPRCIMAVEDLLNKLNIEYKQVSLGTVHLNNPIDPENEISLNQSLNKMGFEILNDKKTQTIEKIKNAIINNVHHQNDPEKIGRLSELLPEILGQNYTSLSSLFSDIEGYTIEKYFILQKIEKSKELLVYEELSISEIAHKLNYSSSQHLSRQFKNVTGLSPSEFKKTTKKVRLPLSEI